MMNGTSFLSIVNQFGSIKMEWQRVKFGPGRQFRKGQEDNSVQFSGFFATENYSYNELHYFYAERIFI